MHDPRPRFAGIIIAAWLALPVASAHPSMNRPDEVTAATPPALLLPTPSARQLAWHERGMYAFVHFDMNTFTDLERGHGDESPKTFHPTALDTDQWCRVF